MAAERSRLASDRVAIALDGLDGPKALRLVDELADLASLFKVGPGLILDSGPGIVEAIRSRGKDVFLDLKFHDIPQTVAASVARAASLSVAMLTVHAAGGRAMLRAARAAAPAGGRTKILAVTVLTSLDAPALGEVFGEHAPDPADLAVRLARLARAEGIDGVVCSPREARGLREALGPDALLVTPGIRAAGGSADDQRRTLSAAAAFAEGADVIVVGRPIVEAASPRAALAAMLDEIGARP
jgi:orotidine-5'-phosphate decarboxylase